MIGPGEAVRKVLQLGTFRGARVRVATGRSWIAPRRSPVRVRLAPLDVCAANRVLRGRRHPRDTSHLRGPWFDPRCAHSTPLQNHAGLLAKLRITLSGSRLILLTFYLTLFRSLSGVVTAGLHREEELAHHLMTMRSR